MFSGCTGGGSSDCPAERCTGPSRCCLDCATQKKNEMKNHVKFTDVHSVPLAVAGISILCYVTLYAFTLLLRQHRMASGFFLVLGCILLIGTSTYTLWYLCVNWSLLLECQTSFVAIISWAWCQMLALMDFMLSFGPAVYRSRNKRRKENVVLKYASAKLVDGLGGLTLLWWVAVGIYLEGVYAGRWRFVH